MIKKGIFASFVFLTAFAMGLQPVSAAECTNIPITLSQGSSGAEVTKLQNFLKAEGYFPAETTGYFGPITSDSVSKFQAANGIDSVGTAGPITRAKIQSVSCGSGQAASSAGGGPASVDVKLNGSNSPSALTGQTFSLSWETQNVQSCVIGANDGGGTFPVDAKSSLTYAFKGTYYPLKNTVYTVSCKDSSGNSVSDTVSVNVNVPKTLVDSLGYNSSALTNTAVPAPTTPSGSVTVSTACSDLSIGTPEVNAAQPGYPWGPAYYSGNPRWREIEWRIQNGISILPNDLAQYYTEYYTAMGFPQYLSGLLRSDGTPFAGPGGIPIPNGAKITLPNTFPSFTMSSGVFEYRTEMGFTGSPNGATTEIWVSPFSSSDRVVCPLKTPLTGTVWNDPEPQLTPPSTKFSIGDTVSATNNINVRATANGTILRTVNSGVQGTVIGGPTYAGGFHWWNVNFGNLGSGWSAENYLTKIQVVPPGGLSIRASFGGASGVVTGHGEPSMSINGALFGHDKSKQQETPVVVTFGNALKNVGFRILYQDPNETFAVGSDNLLVSGTRIRAEYLSASGSLLGTQILGGSNLVGASSESTLPQGYIRVSGPVGSVKLYIPPEYSSAVFFSSGIEE